jgi:DNA-binding PadR family transcriptional regulator
LPLTTYATLGLLSPEGELSAVEIEERAYRFLRFFYWTPALSHIRRELERLEDLGYVDCREVVTGRIKRTLKYWLTPAGEDALREWTESPFAERTVTKNPAILRLWLGRRGADPDIVLSGLETHVEYVKAERESLLEFMDSSEASYRDRASEMQGLTGKAESEAELALWRHRWVTEVMQYCLRDYDDEVRNLALLMQDMKRLASERDTLDSGGARTLSPRPRARKTGSRGSDTDGA